MPGSAMDPDACLHNPSPAVPYFCIVYCILWSWWVLCLSITAAITAVGNTMIDVQLLNQTYIARTKPTWYVVLLFLLSELGYFTQIVNILTQLLVILSFYPLNTGRIYSDTFFHFSRWYSLCVCMCVCTGMCVLWLISSYINCINFEVPGGSVG